MEVVVKKVVTKRIKRMRIEEDDKLYRNGVIELCKKRETKALTEEEVKSWRGLSSSVVAQTEHMIRCIRIQLQKYADKNSQSAWHNAYALSVLYNDLSELQAACASFAFDVSVEIETCAISFWSITTRVFTPFPRTDAYTRYIDFKTKEIFRDRTIRKGSTVEGESVPFDLKELKRLLRRRPKQEYPDDYREILLKCQGGYKHLMFVLQMWWNPVSE